MKTLLLAILSLSACGTAPAPKEVRFLQPAVWSVNNSGISEAKTMVIKDGVVFLK